MLAPINKNKQRARLNRDVLDVRSGFVIIGADATAFYPEGDTAVNVFRASIRVAHASSRAGDGVLAIADFSYGALSRVSCGVSRKVPSGRDAAVTDAKERPGFTSTRDAYTTQSSARGVPRAHKLFRAFTSHELPITDLTSQGRGGGEGCPLGVT